MAREAFISKKLNSSALAVIETCNEIVEEYREQGLTLTLRQLYYQLVARDLFPADRKWSNASGKWVRDPDGTINAEPNYKWLSSIITDARMTGRMDWEAIEDRVRQPRRASQWNSIGALVETAVNAFRLPRWEGQTHYAELWVEKDALAGVLEPLAHEHHVTLMVNRGYSSASAMYESAQRFKRFMRGAGQFDGESRTPVLFYLGDHDPSGEDMVRDVRDRLTLFGVEDLEVEKIALTMEQVRRYNPPPNPAKMTDPRAKDYVREHGDESWEVDALPPNVLAQIVRRSFEGVLDREKYDAVIAREEKGKAALRRAAKKIDGA